MELFYQILNSGVRESLIWLPFVIGIGILHSYLKILDISIDGIVILSGIFCAIIWNYTGSYMISIASTVLISVLLSLIVYSFIFLFRINAIMVGIIFSFAAHSISVIIVGESLILLNTSIFNDFLHIPLWLLLLLVIISAFVFFFFKSYIGIEIKGFGDNRSINTRTNPPLIPLLTYVLVGVLYGIGASLYVHSEGNARSGGSFEFLIVSLGSFLAFDKLFSSTKLLAVKSRFSLLNSVVFKSIVGTLFFQLIIILVIFYTSNPIYWKLIFSAFLFFVLIPFNEYKLIRFRKKAYSGTCDHQLVIKNLNMSYNLGSESRCIFKEAEISFNKGINIIRGANGTGKTTFLKILNGRLSPQKGFVIYQNKNILNQKTYRRDFYLIEQNPFNILASNLTLIENLSIALTNRKSVDLLNGYKILQGLKKKLDAYNIEPIFNFKSNVWYKNSNTLSGGEAQMLCVYMSILSNKSVLLFDEPTTGLDTTNFQRLLEILKILKEHKLILITSHDKRLDDICDSLFNIENYNIELIK